jgi:hypothetical protein
MIDRKARSARAGRPDAHVRPRCVGLGLVSRCSTGQLARGLARAGDLGAHGGSGAGVGVDREHEAVPPAGSARPRPSKRQTYISNIPTRLIPTTLRDHTESLCLRLSLSSRPRNRSEAGVQEGPVRAAASWRRSRRVLPRADALQVGLGGAQSRRRRLGRRGRARGGAATPERGARTPRRASPRRRVGWHGRCRPRPAQAWCLTPAWAVLTSLLPTVGPVSGFLPE